MLIEVSNGEIVDKLTIIEIKLSKIQDPAKRANLLAEQVVLEEAVSQILSKDHPLYEELYTLNAELWDIEDACREHEAEGDFGETFIQVARSVYITNDERAATKKKINEITNSRLTEEKSYQ